MQAIGYLKNKWFTGAEKSGDNSHKSQANANDDNSGNLQDPLARLASSFPQEVSQFLTIADITNLTKTCQTAIKGWAICLQKRKTDMANQALEKKTRLCGSDLLKIFQDNKDLLNNVNQVTLCSRLPAQSEDISHIISLLLQSAPNLIKIKYISQNEIADNISTLEKNLHKPIFCSMDKLTLEKQITHNFLKYDNLATQIEPRYQKALETTLSITVVTIFIPTIFSLTFLFTNYNEPEVSLGIALFALTSSPLLLYGIPNLDPLLTKHLLGKAGLSELFAAKDCYNRALADLGYTLPTRKEALDISLNQCQSKIYEIDQNLKALAKKTFPCAMTLDSSPIDGTKKPNSLMWQAHYRRLQYQYLGSCESQMQKKKETIETLNQEKEVLILQHDAIKQELKCTHDVWEKAIFFDRV